MRKLILIVSVLAFTTALNAKVHVPDSVMHRDGLYVDNLKQYNDSAIFQGAILKLDLFSPAFYAGISKGRFQTYELALSFRLKQRFYPTMELGYAGGTLETQGTAWSGQGGWSTVGLDLNGLKRNVNSLNALLVGIRIGAAMQKYDLTNVKVEDGYWQSQHMTDYQDLTRAECWGEIVGGCQVHIYSGLMMGWYVRLKLLFTRKVGNGEPYPYFIPGFGYRDNTQWGINYYIAWKF